MGRNGLPGALRRSPDATRAAHRAYPEGQFAAIKWVNIKDPWYEPSPSCLAVGGDRSVERAAAACIPAGMTAKPVMRTARGCPFHLFDPGLIESEADLLGGSVIGHRATKSTVKSPVTSGRRLAEGGTIASA